MPKVQFTKALNRFFDDLNPVEIDATNIKDMIDQVETIYPGIQSYLLENNGSLRKHVNIFIGEDMISDKINLSDKIKDNDQIFIMQALSGG